MHIFYTEIIAPETEKENGGSEAIKKRYGKICIFKKFQGRGCHFVSAESEYAKKCSQCRKNKGKKHENMGELCHNGLLNP